jgi:hypothetical protein
MIRQFSLRLAAFLLLATFASSASACCLLPFLNPFAWCGYGCGNGCYGAGYGYSMWNPCCSSGYGYGSSYGGYQSYGGSVYTPSYAPGYGAPAADCNCGAATGPAAVPQAIAPGAAWNSQATPWSGRTAWQPQHQWTPGPASWQSQQYGMNPQAMPQQTAMSTAPIYGPTWETPAPQAGYRPQVAGDIQGDHEFHAIPNAYRGGARPPIHRASFQRFPQTTRRYPRAVR